MSPTLKNLKEEAFEKHIYDALASMHGYRKRDAEKYYDKARALDPELLFEFLSNTQPDKIARLEEMYGEKMQERVLKRLSDELKNRGVIDVLRKGIEEGPVKLELIFFKPISALNKETQELYKQNIWSVMRQVYFSEKTEQSLDLALFVNGIPIATSELKNEITGQNVWHAIRQYKTDRDPKEILFSFKRCAAHFAVDTSEVFVTTKLAKQSTYFLPFNKGYNHGAGNPPEEDGHKTKYLWEEVWAPDSWLELLQNFVHVFKETKEKEDGTEYEVEIQAFPRFHQRKTVLDIVDSIKSKGAGENYLIQHSAGSGKSMTIAWSSFRLAEAHNDKNEKIFDTIIVMTDRRALDKQLREIVRSFTQTEGYLFEVSENNPESKGRQLKKALEAGARVITTTIQTFPVVAELVESLPGNTFGLIVDEAHSSQSGETARTINEVLGEDVETEEDWILRQVESRKQPKNLSYFAFTATPKPQTVERFGTKQADGSYRPFSLYSMKQAIDEKFILDVLKNYTTYKTYFKIIKEREDDPEVPRNKALSTIIRYVNLHDDAIAQKVEIITAHFENTIRDLMDGKSKAMVVTRSRKSAVLYKLVFDEYLKKQGYDYKTLVAFTDSIKVDGASHTETSMNGGIPESNTVEEFKKPQYKFLIVAEKHQTGFDQPLLCAMYVDKTLSGVQAVQTLSRLNRTAPDKSDVFVLDFVNNTDDIKEAFDPYYTTTILSEGTDINTLNDLRRDIFDIYKIQADALDEFAELLSKTGEDIHEDANALLDRFVDDVTRLEDEKYSEFKSKIYQYTKSYPFISQILNYSDVSHEKLYLFLKYLIKKLPKDQTGGPLDILDLIDLEDIRVVKKMSGSIALEESEADIVETVEGEAGQKGEEDVDVLSEIIKAVNKQWGAEFGEEQQETLTEMAEELASDEEFEHVVKNSSRHGANLKFEGAFKNKYDDQFENDYKLWEQLTNNTDLRKYVRSKMFDYVLEKMKK
tara:strand:- start:1990 stop:4932 length:2943 start_codon:yes stop_codon:yes gene_type:complete